MAEIDGLITLLDRLLLALRSVYLVEDEGSEYGNAVSVLLANGWFDAGGTVLGLGLFESAVVPE